ncbi:LysM peptidoglycan-binding domain-containing protein [Pontibacillus marinus]|uniref:Spore germination protein n=1 Tax=Pontibacillus marinus BH030004 = DSM 16465 TaxID=1385511 RepID=A0A0A5GBP3_9BACI|nr:LysM peptidoglycan-binding domain-containing protein [Pontibacillus marinus]KGX90596.1 spore germination protein [Pontibacillus marinus BH030004 = DSM 16465]
MTIVDSTHLIYSVESGDTLYSIASRTGGNIQDIVQSNAIYPPITDPGLIFPGQVLILTKPGKNQVQQIVSQGDRLYQYAYRYDTSVDLLQGINPQVDDPNMIYPSQQLLVPAFIYEVEQGDTLYKIAQRFGLSLSTLMEANRARPGLSPDVIYPGYRLIIPLPSSVNIVVFRPFPGTSIQSGQLLKGYARAFEGTILYRIVDDANQVVKNEAPIQTSAGAPSYGSFSMAIEFDDSPTTKTGELWVYTRSAKDGSIQDLVQIPVFF